MPASPRIAPSMRAAARGMAAQRKAIGAASENLANASTSQTEDGDPFAIKRAVQDVDEANYSRLDRASEPQTDLRSTNRRHLSGASQALETNPGDLGPTTEIDEVEKERLEYDPSHPHADEEGYVHYPDVNVAQEMARLTSASRLYEANLSAVQATKSMMEHTFRM